MAALWGSAHLPEQPEGQQGAGGWLPHSVPANASIFLCFYTTALMHGSGTSSAPSTAGDARREMLQAAATHNTSFQCFHPSVFLLTTYLCFTKEKPQEANTSGKWHQLALYQRKQDSLPPHDILQPSAPNQLVALSPSNLQFPIPVQ